MSLSSERCSTKEDRRNLLFGTSDDPVAQLLSTMSVADKIGQMAQLDISMLLSDDQTRLDDDKIQHYIGQLGVGSVLNTVPVPWTAADYRRAALQLQQVTTQYQRPPVIWGLDSVHGANYVHGAIVTPQPLNLAATFNTTVAYEAGKLASRDTRAAGISWLFSPLLGLAFEPRWARVYETFGEDVHLVGTMAAEMIRGIQQDDDDETAVPRRAAACAKHFVGYSYPHNGHDRAPSWIPTRHLYQYFVPLWQRAMDAHVWTVMESYTEYDGVPNVANPESTLYLLRQRLGFEGVLVTDYNEMRNLYEWHHTVESYDDAAVTSLRQSSVDMSMIPWEWDSFSNSVTSGLGNSHELSLDRINTSVERVLRLKETLGMLDDDHKLTEDDPNLALVGTDEALALDMARQSLILVKNDQNVLPLDISGNKRLQILVTGPTASSRIYQSGGWTGQWQGAPNEADWFTYGTTVLAGMSAQSSWDVSYSCGSDIHGNDCQDETSRNGIIQEVEDFVGLGPHDALDRAVDAASSADVIVVCVGEEAYAEKPGDIRSLSLPQGQYDLVKSLRDANADAKVVLVYFGGRPRLLGDMVDQADAVVIGFLPGPSAGQAMVDVLRGTVNPSGRLPLTYPLYDDGGGLPYFRAVSDRCRDDVCQVQWPFGHGLSYTTFDYSGLTVSGGGDQDLHLSVKVRNSGTVAGAEVVLFFTFDESRPTTPEYKRLRAFDKVYLNAGDETTVTRTVPAKDLKFVGPHDDKHYVFDFDMKTVVGVGAWTDCRKDPDSSMCARVQINNLNEHYVGACDAACELWKRSDCADDFGMSNDACLNMCSSISEYPASAMDKGNQGWGWNYVSCLENVVFGLEQESEAQGQCRRMTTLCRDIFQTGKLDEYGNGPAGNLTPSSIGGTPPLGNFVALFAGLLATAFIVYLIRGGKVRRNDSGEIQFTPVRNDLE